VKAGVKKDERSGRGGGGEKCNLRRSTHQACYEKESAHGEKEGKIVQIFTIRSLREVGVNWYGWVYWKGK